MDNKTLGRSNLASYTSNFFTGDIYRDDNEDIQEDDLIKGAGTKYSLNFANLQQAADKKKDFYAATYKAQSEFYDLEEKQNDDSSDSDGDYDAEKAE